MVKILFVCHGNICRSPMAACLFSQMAKARGLDCVVSSAATSREAIIWVTVLILPSMPAAMTLPESAATSREEIGNPMYPPARRKLKEMGVPFGHHRAVQMTREDYGAYDFLLAMDSANVKNMKAIAGGDPEGKIRRLLDGTPHPRDIADPWYTGNFDATYADLAEGCQALLDRLEKMSYLKNPSE